MILKMDPHAVVAMTMAIILLRMSLIGLARLNQIKLLHNPVNH